MKKDNIQIDTNSLAHTKWECKYHIVFAPKYRRKVFYEEKRLEIREILPNINFHALRHTFATRALEAGMDIKVLSSILGHAQASTTLNLYAHALPDHKRESMQKMGAFYVK